VDEIEGFCQCLPSDEGCLEQQWETGKERPNRGISKVAAVTNGHYRHVDHAIGCVFCWDIRFGNPKCGRDKEKAARIRSGAMSVMLDDPNLPEDFFSCDPDSYCQCNRG
jgi:hypothetical protein